MDLLDISPNYLWYLGYGIGVMAAYFIFLLYGWPLLQAVIQHQNKVWLGNVISRAKGMSAADRETLLKAAEPESKHTLYKLTKFSYLISGVILAIAGLLVIILQEADPDVVKNIVYIPLILGAVSIYLYKTNYSNSKLWKETAGFFGILGVCITLPGIFGIMNGMDEIRHPHLYCFGFSSGSCSLSRVNCC